MFLTFICCYMLNNIPVVTCAQITHNPKNVVISAGMEATFKCTVKLDCDVDEELTCDVGWWTSTDRTGTNIAAGNNIIIQDNRYSIERTSELKHDGKYIFSTLKITKVNHIDEGRFTCYILKNSTIQSWAWLTVKQVPEPQCMPLPRSVTITDSITLSCMIGPRNYVTRLTWYVADHTEKIKSQVLHQATMKSYLNTTVTVIDYVNGTIFKCVAADPNNTRTETCSTNPLNIVENEPRSLDVEVHALSTLPLTAGKQACLECKVSCINCVGLIKYTWAFNGSAIQSPSLNRNRTCFKNILLSDDDQPLRCTANFGIEKGVGELLLKVVDTMTTPETEIQSQDIDVTGNTPSTIKYNNGNNNHLENNIIILITIPVIIIIIIFIILGLFCVYRQHKLRLRENIQNSNEEMHINKNATRTESQNNQQQNSLGLDTTQMYAKVQKEKNSTIDEQNLKQLAPSQIEELTLMYKPLEMNNLAQEESIEDISDLYAKVDKLNENVKRSPDVTHWQSSSGDVYAYVQKNKASTLPANQRRPASKPLPSTKPKLLKATTNQETTSPTTVNNTCEMTTYRNDTEKVNEMAKTDNNDRKSQNEQTTTKENLDEKVTKQKASTMSPSSGHDSMSFDAQGLHYADLEFTNDPAHQSISPQSGGVIYADITKQ